MTDSMVAEPRCRVAFRITPRRAREDAWRHSKSLYTVSMGGLTKPIAGLVGTYIWATERFEKCALLIGDGLYRHTLRICEGLSESEAEIEAVARGSRLLKEIEAHLVGTPYVIKTSDLLSWPAYQECRREIERLYEIDAEFAESVDEDARDFVRRQLKRKQVVIPHDIAFRYSIKYLTEEVAMYYALAKDKWLVDVYMGKELPTLAKIIDGEIANAPEPLKNRINISVGLR